MKKINCLIFTLFSTLTLVGCGNNNKYDNVITDALGREVKIVNEPKTFACLGPGCLRQYCYVADTSKLVGIENCERNDISPNQKPYINAIPNYKELPIIGEGGPKDQTNVEQLLKLHPDVVFTSYVGDKKALDDLNKRTGLSIVAVGYNSNGLFAQDIYDSLKLIGKITGNEKRANDVVEYFENSKAELVEKTSDAPTKQTGYLGAVNHRGSFGIESTTGDFPIFDVLGIKNVVNDKGIHDFSVIEKESLYTLKPDKIIIDAGGLTYLKEDMKKHPSFYDKVEAFKNHEVYVELPFVFYSNNFDVALANAYYVGSVFYPEKFENFDIKTKFNEITKFLVGKEVYDQMTTHFKCEYGKLEYTL